MEHILSNLNSVQRTAVLHGDGPLIIFAGAGTGKTRVITHRIAYLLSQGASPYEILAVTFTNKAADEMRKRVDALVPGSGRSVWVSTFHSFGARFLRSEAKALGLAEDFLVYDVVDQKNIVKKCLEELGLDEKRFKPWRLVETISRAKDELLDADSFAIHAMTSGDPFRQAAASVYSLYSKKLKSAGSLDFGDLLMLTVNALRDNKEILERYQNRFKYVLVDEYQDTNRAQYLLAKYLSQKHGNICVVGDDDQSIYSWRGADIKNILEFEKDYPNCKMVKLEQNYRSTSNILASAWSVVKNNSTRADKKVWTENAGGNVVKIVDTENEIEEAQWIVDELEKLKKNEGCNLLDFAVFYRTNAQSRVLEDAFRRSGIPYIVVGTLRFYERAEVKDILAYLKMIHNPKDNLVFRRIINSPRRGIGKTSLETLDRFAAEKNVSLWESLSMINETEISGGAKKAFTGFKALIDGLRLVKSSLTIKEIALQVLEKTLYVKELEAEDTTESKMRIENLQELISAIDEFEQRSSDKSLAGYLMSVALVSGIDDMSKDADAARVTLMTLHLAKGLEFKSVFITGLEEGLFPIGESSFDRDDLEEERRLMYVGMTRAKDHLYLTWAAQRRVFGKSQWNMPSRFIEEARRGGFAEKILHANSAGNTTYIDKEEPVIRYEEPEDISGYNLGSRVRHQLFGDGKVIEKSGSGDDLKLVVLFDSGQWKKLYAKYANLAMV